MSRARPIHTEHGVHWFDTSKNGHPATDQQIELLATVENKDFEELLDECSEITQGELILRIRKSLGTDQIPESVLRIREQHRAERAKQPSCRICSKKGDSTRHHFVNKWILQELNNYNIFWADRRVNCIPVCLACHRKLHSRNQGEHSIVEYLTESEKEFADKALSALAEERPHLLILIAKGDKSVYEARLVKDWLEGMFTEINEEFSVSDIRRSADNNNNSENK